jgi:hypothetical protein
MDGTRVRVKSVRVSAQIHRVNGNVEDLGVIYYRHPNRLRVWLWRLGQWWQKRK